jgi:hypothetical protein
MTTMNVAMITNTFSLLLSLPPILANSGILNCGTGRIQFATPCAAVFLGLTLLMLLQQQAMERAFSSSTQ